MGICVHTIPKTMLMETKFVATLSAEIIHNFKPGLGNARHTCKDAKMLDIVHTIERVLHAVVRVHPNVQMLVLMMTTMTKMAMEFVVTWIYVHLMAKTMLMMIKSVVM